MEGSVLFMCKQTWARFAFGVLGVSLVAAVVGGGPSREEGLPAMFSSLIPWSCWIAWSTPSPPVRPREGPVLVDPILKSPSLFSTLSHAPPDITGQFLWDLTGRICQSNSCKSQQKLRGLILVCCIEKLPINISPLCFIITVKFVLCTYYLRDNRAGVPFYEAIIWFTLAP